MLCKNCGSGIFITNDISDCFCLMFADDVAGCAETAIKLQQQINTIDHFCLTWMEINMDKTEITGFSMVVLFVDMKIGLIVERKLISRLSINTWVYY